MKNFFSHISRPLFYTLLAVLVLTVLAAVVASGHHSHDFGPTLMIMDDDLSDSVLGWLIAIPIMLLVGVVLAVVFAGVALIAVVAVGFAAILGTLALLLAFTPVVILMALPFLAIYGLVKLFQRDSARIAASA